MSIAPVEGFPPPRTEPPLTNQTTNANVRSANSASHAQPAAQEEVSQPVSESGPKPEGAAPKSVVRTYELPQDVVEVHQDPEFKNQVIIQYLDKAKDVILQVPSSQELDVERGIAQEFQQAAKLRAVAAAAPPASEGEKNHGD